MSHKFLFRLFVPFGLGYFLSMLLGSANAIMAPILIDEFALSPSDLGMMSSMYLIAFGAAQFPLGIFLDKFGARRTLAALMVFTAVGTFLFASAQNVCTLVAARICSGIGLSGCLMAAFKAYAHWLPPSKLPVIYSLQSLMGGIGGIIATSPMSVALDVMPWRAVFYLLVVFVVLEVLFIWFVVPKDDVQVGFNKSNISMMLYKMFLFTFDKRFIAIAPIVVTVEGVMFAYSYLWIGPWMHDVALMSDVETGVYMMYASIGLALGYVLNGIMANYLKKHKILSWEELYIFAGILFIAAITAIIVISNRESAWIWSIAMFMATMTMIAFPIMRTLFEEYEVGRILSLLNFYIFFASFIFQWLVGHILELYPVVDTSFSPQGYRVGLICMVVVNALSVLWSIIAINRRRRLKQIYIAMD